jgi:hypothetical protein
MICQENIPCARSNYITKKTNEFLTYFILHIQYKNSTSFLNQN